jgi:hypothetical protein
MEWGVLYLQGARGFSLESASWIIGFSAFFAILGTVGAGWLSDFLFKGNRVKPALIAGMISDHTEAATITPAAKPRSAFCTRAETSWRAKSTDEAPSIVPNIGKSSIVIVFITLYN